MTDVLRHNQFVLVITILKEYDDTKHIKEFKASTVHRRFWFIYKTMLFFCLKYRKNKESKNPKVVKANKGRMMLSSKCAIFDSEKSKFTKYQESGGFAIASGIFYSTLSV